MAAAAPETINNDHDSLKEGADMVDDRGSLEEAAALVDDDSQELESLVSNASNATPLTAEQRRARAMGTSSYSRLWGPCAVLAIMVFLGLLFGLVFDAGIRYFSNGVGSSPNIADDKSDFVDCHANPCLNGGTCRYEDGRSYGKIECTCREGFSGLRCETCEAAVDPQGSSLTDWPEHWKFYMYEPPPHFFKVLSKKVRTINFGFGPKMPDFVTQNVTINGQWATDHYTLEMVTRFRMMNSPHRTYDPNEALFFYMPFYGSEQIHTWMDEEFQKEYGKADDLIKMTRDFVLSKPFYNRTRGRDHMLTYGRMSDDGRLHSYAAFTNMTYISVETQIPYKCKKPHAGECDFENTEDFLKRNEQLIYHSRYMHSVPYPSGYHLGDGVTRRYAYGAFSRENLVSAFFDNRLPFRNRVKVACDRSPKCVFGNSAVFKNNVTKGTEIITSLYLNSVFSLQPPGDSWSRRAYFDSIQHGCIPVFFHKYQYENQWEWHLPHFEEISVTLPWESVYTESTFDIIGALEEISAEEIERMQRKIESIAPRTMWSLGGAGHPDGTPDAHDIMLRGIFELKERELKEEGFWPKEHVDYWGRSSSVDDEDTDERDIRTH